MKRITIATLLLIPFSFSIAQIETWMQRSESEGTFTSHQFHSAVFEEEHAYLAGEFWRDIQFDEFAAAVPQGGETQDAFVLKLDPEGNAQEFYHISGDGYERVSDLAFDNEGDLWLCGFFNQTLIYGDSTYTSTGFYDAFAMHLTETGELLAFYQFSPDSPGQSINIDEIAINKLGQVWLMANFVGNWTLGDTNYNSGLTQDGLLFSLNLDGELLSSHHFSSDGEEEEDLVYLEEVKVDLAHNVLVGGVLAGEVSIDGESVDLDGTNGQAFIRKMTPQGTEIWTQTYASTYSQVNCITILDDNSIVAGIQFQDEIEFNGNTINGNGSFGEMLLVALKENGAPLWLAPFLKEDFQATGGVYPIDIVQDGEKIYLGGFYSGTVLYQGTPVLTSADQQWAYIFELDFGGILQESYSFTSTAFCRNQFLAPSSMGIFFGGEFAQNISFQGTTLTRPNSTLYYGLLATRPVNTNEPSLGEKLQILPNPGSDYVQLQLPDGIQPQGLVQVYNSQGQLVQQITFRENYQVFDTQSLAKGTYFWRLVTNEELHFGQWVKN